ncbi:hypothetical protein [Kitasatospora sp. MAA4]|uniref:hypothetical protein n=1 Tax=Kitasatospora sp. MAA4 TaxID=3035093 RepID=UPI0024771C0B|nr:hypothetical protein [Kitasatospora sp. MAA4]
MIESTERAGNTWWALIRGKLAACWWQLLAVQVLFAGAVVAELRLSVALDGSGLRMAGDLFLLAANGLTAAWSWSAVLRILDGGHGILSALRPDLRRVWRLAGWLVALDVFGLLRLLCDIDVNAYVDIAFSPMMKAVLLGSVYLLFAAALLPMAILLEGRGFRRAFRLSHGGWSTVLRVLPVVLIGSVASSGLQYWQTTTLGTFPAPPHAVLVQVAAALGGALKDALTAVLLYAAYRLSSPADSSVKPPTARRS